MKTLITGSVLLLFFSLGAGAQTSAGDGKAPANLVVTSYAFRPQQLIPDKYSCAGQNINPPLTVSGAPDGTKSLALVMDDPDAPNGTMIHWIVWNIPPGTEIAENSLPGEQGKNGNGKVAYTGPCPPSGIHRYVFHVYALDTMLELPIGASRAELEAAMANHIIATGTLTGLFTTTM